MSILINDALLKKHPKLIVHLQNYINKKSIKGKPVPWLNGSRCWTFTGHVNKAGYGIIGTTNRKIIYDTMHGFAHRVSYMVFNGPTKGSRVLHHCDNPVCVCPDHLYIGTQKKNMQDASERFAYAHPTNKSWQLLGYEKRMMELMFGSFTFKELAEHFKVSIQSVRYYHRKWLGL